MPDFDAMVFSPRARATIHYPSGAAIIPMTSIKSIKVLRERRTEGQGIPYGTMAANELQMSIVRDPDRAKFDYIKGIKITVEEGTEDKGVTTYVQAGEFFAEKWDLSNEELIPIIAYDWRYALSSKYYSLTNLANTKNIGEIAADILTDAGVDPEKYIIAGLYYVPPIVIIPRMTSFQAICLCLAADNGAAVMDNNGVLFINDGPSSSSVKTLTADIHILTGLENVIDSSSIATVVDAVWYEYVISDTGVTVAKTSSPITIAVGESATFLLKWLSTEWKAIDALAMGTVEYTPSEAAFSYDDNISTPEGALVTIANLGSVSVTLTKIEFSGLPVTDSSRTAETVNADAASQYGRIVFQVDNALIQSYDQAKSVGRAILDKYSSPGLLWKIPCIGDPALEPGDIVTIPNNDGGQIDVQIERSDTDFGGTTRGITDNLVARYSGPAGLDLIVHGNKISPDQVVFGDKLVIGKRRGYVTYGG